MLVVQGLGKLVFDYRAKTPGATGSFGFLVVSLCCCRTKLSIAIQPIHEGEPYEPWLESLLLRLLELVPRAIVLVDRGFAHMEFFLMFERLGARYVVRLEWRYSDTFGKSEKAQALYSCRTPQASRGLTSWLVINFP